MARMDLSKTSKQQNENRKVVFTLRKISMIVHLKTKGTNFEVYNCLTPTET